jgi:hypothetical protein
LGKIHDRLMKFSIRKTSSIFFGAIGFKHNGGLVAFLWQMAIQAILCNVQNTVFEPPHVGAIKIPLKHLGKRLLPNKRLGNFGPKRFGVTDTVIIYTLVIF